MKIISIVFLLVFLVFMCATPKVDIEYTAKKNSIVIDKEVLDFLNTKLYQYSDRKSDIPEFVLKKLSEIAGEQLVIFDAEGGPSGVYTAGHQKHLYFILRGDSVCLIGYVSMGGATSSEVVDYVDYRKDFKLIRYKGSFPHLPDVSKLQAFFDSRGLRVEHFPALASDTLVTDW